MSSSLLRLSKLLSQKGYCSRREADVWIEKGWVLVDNKPIKELGTKVCSDAHITLLPQAKKQKESKLTFLLHKPLGYVSCQPEKGYPSSLELIREAFRDTACCQGPKIPSYLPKLAVAGRLDINSVGLLVITQDGTIAKTLIGEDSLIEKEYLVRVSSDLNQEQVKLLQSGLHLDGKALKTAKVKRLDTGYFQIILKEGRYRQIRRMCELVDLKVISIKRVRIGKIRLGSLKPGHWRLLKPGEHF